jgi:hypothetical protein
VGFKRQDFTHAVSLGAITCFFFVVHKWREVCGDGFLGFFGVLELGTLKTLPVPWVGDSAGAAIRPDRATLRSRAHGPATYPLITAPQFFFRLTAGATTHLRNTHHRTRTTTTMAPKSKKPTSKVPRDAAPVTTDSRFSVIHHDPRFAPPKRKDTSITLDSRFASVLHDSKFSSSARVDRYGRKLPKQNAKAELSRFYRLAEEEEEEGEEGKPRFDPARGEGVVDTESSSEESEDEEEVEMEEGVEEEVQAQEIPQGEVTRRFAAVNMDWDNVRAVDLMKAFSSFAPSGGRVVKVTVYPSEFGRQRMEREELEGPPREIFAKDEVEEEEEDEVVDEKTIVKEDKGEEFDSAKLRQYQLERLRYYYAVVECDSDRTAKHIYENCDGAEYEATANFFDLRFIPDDTNFDDDKPRDECEQDPTNYTPNEFVTDALQHSKVKLTWDEDDQQRKQVAKKAFSQREVEENELKAYLASSDSESDGDDKESKKEKYRALLGGLTFGGKTKGEPTGEMEVTFTSGLEGEDKNGKVLELEETALEKYIRKEKERKKARKEKHKAKIAAANGDAAPAQKQASAEAEEVDQAAVDLGFNDPFFDEPVQSNAALKKAEKQKKREAKAAEAAEKASKRAELELLMEDDEQILGKDGKKLAHFDMKQVVKAEKLKKVKKSKLKKKALEQAEGLQDDFEIDVKDPRFGAVFERHDFAIDPTNPRFINTENTKKLMEEKRKRTAARAGGDKDGAPEEGREVKRKKTGPDGGKKDELSRLVQSLKKKSKGAKA